MDSSAGQDPKVRQFLHRAQQEYDGDASDDNISIQGVDRGPLNDACAYSKIY